MDRWALFSWLGKEAGELAKLTSRSQTMKVDAAGGSEDAVKAMDAATSSASQIPTRYGRKPYSRGMTRDST